MNCSKVNYSKVLLITDRTDLARVQAHTLVCSGIDVSEMNHLLARTKISAADLKGYDLILLNMFDEEGSSIEICRKLRAQYHNPIIILVYERDERFLLRAYEAGADDCLVHPVSINLLLAKVQAWLRTAASKHNSVRLLEAYNFRFNLSKSELITPEDTRVQLSQLEARFLHLLFVNNGRIVSTDVILQRVWSDKSDMRDGDRQMLKVLVHRLRRKIERNSNAPQYIHTIRHQGYSFRPN